MDNLNFIRVRQDDPDYSGRLSDAIVNVSMIVRIVPRWYETGPDGSKYLACADNSGPESRERILQRDYFFYDATGMKFDTAYCDEETKDFIGKLWIRFGLPEQGT